MFANSSSDALRVCLQTRGNCKRYLMFAKSSPVFANAGSSRYYPAFEATPRLQIHGVHTLKTVPRVCKQQPASPQPPCVFVCKRGPSRYYPAIEANPRLQKHGVHTLKTVPHAWKQPAAPCLQTRGHRKRGITDLGHWGSGACRLAPNHKLRIQK